MLGYGADLRFRRWGKLEANVVASQVTVGQHRLLSRLDSLVTAVTNGVSAVLSPLWADRPINGVLTGVRKRLIRVVGKRTLPNGYDEFVCECYSYHDEPVTLLLEHRFDEVVVFRHAFEINPGHNFHTIPASRFKPARAGTVARLSVYPADDAECRLVFTWLDLVRYADAANKAPATAGGNKPATKVKCVAWDLDNTLWGGVLVEDGPENLRLNQACVELIKALDERGIIQTVVSKNDHDQAWGVIKKLGLDEYFLYPSINWGQKSTGLAQIAKALNINTDTFALIDDSSFERAEVAEALPEVRVFSDAAVESLLERDEFDVPVTETSKQRRMMYRQQVDRDRAVESYSGDYTAFLKSCEMEMRVFVPGDKKQETRLLELIQRSNQLNLSTRRYSQEEFAGLLNTQGVLCLGFACADRFGNYGIVGFASVDERSDPPRVMDFVMSCRVAQKRVEHAFFGWLAQRQRTIGKKRLEAVFIKTARNSPLFQVFDDMPFEQQQIEDNQTLFELALDREISGGVVTVIDETGGVLGNR